MNKKIKIEINNSSPKGIVNFLGNVHNKVGTYDREKIEYFKKKLIEKGLLVGEKILFVVDKMDEITGDLIDTFLDKIVDNSVRLRMESQLEEESFLNFGDQIEIDEIEKYVPISSIVPARHINFEDLEPLGQIIEEEEDIDELKELKMELLFNEQEDKNFSESDGTRKK